MNERGGRGHFNENQANLGAKLRDLSVLSNKAIQSTTLDFSNLLSLEIISKCYEQSTLLTGVTFTYLA